MLRALSWVKRAPGRHCGMKSHLICKRPQGQRLNLHHSDPFRPRAFLVLTLRSLFLRSWVGGTVATPPLRASEGALTVSPSEFHSALPSLVLWSTVSLWLLHPKFLKVTIKGFADGTPGRNRPNTKIQSSQLHTVTEAFHSYSPVRLHPSILIFMTLFFLEAGTSMTEDIFRT